MSNEPGRLYVVATPIGNRADLSERAREVLAGVDCVAAEDTRHTGRLLAHWGLRPTLVSFHEHNELARIEGVRARLRAGQSVAVVSDAGTPLISDPGYRLVRELRFDGIAIEVVPGPCSITAALSVAGLPTDRFVYEGFLPQRASARRQRLQALAGETRTLVVLESSHRIRQSIDDMVAVFGSEREATICRELTKVHETVRLDSLAGLSDWLAGDANQRRGEFVVVIRGAPEATTAELDKESERILDLLAAELPTKQAARLAAGITGCPRNTLYAYAIARDSGDD